MPSAICIVPVCPLRETSSHRAEQVSQLLFGEACEIMKIEKHFVQVKTLYDNYIGWVQSIQIAEVANSVTAQPSVLAAGFVNMVLCNGAPMYVPFGSDIGFLKGGEMTLGKMHFSYTGDVWRMNRSVVAGGEIRQVAKSYLNVAYQWGGRSVFGIDCSGFTQMVYKFIGESLPRDAGQQAVLGDVVGFLQEAKCGDLAFFDNEEGRITHVGILLNQEEIIHASGKVKIDTIDHAGIVNEEGKRTHSLRVIKRIILV